MKLGELEPDDLEARLNRGGIFLQTGPFVCHLRSPLREIARAVHFGYADFSLAEEEGFADFHVRVAPAGGLRRWFRPQVLFFLDNRLAFVPFPLQAAVPVLEWGLNWCVSVHAHQYLMIHAAVLEREGRALILAGDSGAGKSTLCAALVLHRWRLLSDEITIVRPEDGRLVPLPRPVSLKNESIGVIRRRCPEGQIGPEWSDTVKGTVAHMRPPAESVRRADEMARAAWVIFPRFQPGLEPRSRRFPRGAALMRLADNSFNYSLLGARGFETMAGLVGRCNCYEFRYGDLQAAVERFDTLPLPGTSNGTGSDG